MYYILATYLDRVYFFNECGWNHDIHYAQLFPSQNYALYLSKKLRRNGLEAKVVKLEKLKCTTSLK